MKRNQIFHLVSQVRAAVNEHLEVALAERGLEGLAPSHGDILAALFREGPLGMTELAAEIRRRKNTVTVLVGKLEAQGYVERVADAEDARRALVSLTRKGSALREPFGTISADLLSKGLAGLGEAELETTMRCLERIIANFLE